MAGRTEGRRSWRYPAVGLGTALLVTLVPGQPCSLEDWPASGPFGAFTWAAFVFALGLALTLLLLAAVLLGRRRRGTARRGLGVGRVLAASAVFGVLAASAFGAAARSDLLETYPGPALGLTLAAGLALTALARRLTPDSGAVETASEAETETEGETEGTAGGRGWNPPSGLTRAVGVFAALYGLLWLAAASGLLGWLIGPVVGEERTLSRPTAVFWSEDPFFDYANRRNAGEGADAALRPPDSRGGKPRGPRYAVLPKGARVEVKGWVDAGGAEVRVGHDPLGRHEGQWGYLWLGDLSP